MLKEALRGALTPAETELLSSSFDVIGTIAVLKIPDELESKEKIIGSEILARMKNVHTVLNQVSDVAGEFRTRDLRLVAGTENYETVYKENGCLFKVNVMDVYFSPRLSTERERVARIARDGERIFNMFAGVGTFSIIIAKQKHCIVDSVDKNPAAIELAKQSLALNRKLAGRVVPVLGDAMDYARSHVDTYDRVLMPLPERSAKFLPFALDSCKRKEGSTIHYYVHLSLDDYRSKAWIERHLASLNLDPSLKLEVTNWKRVREVGPRYIQAVADIRISER